MFLLGDRNMGVLLFLSTLQIIFNEPVLAPLTHQLMIKPRAFYHYPTSLALAHFLQKGGRNYPHPHSKIIGKAKQTHSPSPNISVRQIILLSLGFLRSLGEVATETATKHTQTRH